MTRILRSCSFAVALVAALLFVAPAPAQAQLSTDSIIKNLMNLGVAHPVSGKLFPGGITDATTVVGAVTQNTDNVLNTLSVDDELLARVGRGLIIAGWGTTAANGNTKDIKLFLGSTAICTFTDKTDSGKNWLLAAVVLTTGTDAQIGYCIGVIDGSSDVGANLMFTATEDANVTQTVKTTGNNNSAAASAATGKGLVVVPIG